MISFDSSCRARRRITVVKKREPVNPRTVLGARQQHASRGGAACAQRDVAGDPPRND
jgi:hypothetical protein